MIARKHDASVHREWMDVTLGEGELVVHAPAGSCVMEADGSTWRMPGRAITVFPYRWCNVTYIELSEGPLLYCNIASNPHVSADAETLCYVDYDLDVEVFADGRVEVLDIEEFQENARRFGYPETLRKELLAALDELRDEIAARRGPFASGYFARFVR